MDPEKMAFRSMFPLAVALLLGVSCLSQPVPNPKCEEDKGVCCPNCGAECTLPGELGACFKNCDTNCPIEPECIIADEAPFIDFVVSSACSAAKQECQVPIPELRAFASATGQITQEECCQMLLGSCAGSSQRRFSECSSTLPLDENGEPNYGMCSMDEFQRNFNDAAEEICKENICEGGLCNPLIGDDPRCA